MRALRQLPPVRAFAAVLGRYVRRHGPQHAAAITYFSVLSLVPVLMLVGAAVGFTLTVLRPDWLAVLRDAIQGAFGESSLSTMVVNTFNNAVWRWRELFGVALVAAAYAGTSWVWNLRVAFVAMVRPDNRDARSRPGFLRQLARNLVDFGGLLVFLLASIAIAAAGLAWFGGDGLGGFAVKLLLRLAMSWLVFAFLYLRLPLRPLGWRTWLPGSIIGACAVAVLQQFAGALLVLFSRNVIALVFGPVIVAMVLFNLMAVIMLLCFAATGERLVARRPVTAATKTGGAAIADTPS